MTIQRYEMHGQYDQWDMEPDAEGKYVLFADHEAAVAAARAEGMREAARIGSAAAIEYWTEANKPVSERKYGGTGLPGCVAAAILAAAEAPQ